MRFIFFVLSVLALLFVGAIVGPSFVDWNKYKPQIVEQVKNATGLDVAVGGDLSLAILPSPRVKIEGLVVSAPLKKKFENLLSMKSVEVSVQLIPLLRKEVKVKSVTLVEPDIQLEIMEDGRPSWTTDKLAQNQQVFDAAPEEMKEGATSASNKVLESIALDKLEIKNGKLTFIDHQKGANHQVQDVDVVLKASSLKGPFDLKGSLVYQDKKISLDTKTGKMPKGDEDLSIQAVVSFSDADAALTFKGVTTLKEPYEVQGQTNIKVSSLSNLEKAMGIPLGGYNKPISLDGLLTANQDEIFFDNLKLSLDSFVGNGKISVQNLKNRTPLKVAVDIKSSSVLDIDDFIQSNKKTAQVEIVKSAHAAQEKSFVPQSLTLPMLVDADVKFDLGGVKLQDQILKGTFLDLNKMGKVTKASFKALDLPGQSKLDGNLKVVYASASQSSKTGQVTYVDPTVTYAVNGQANQLATFLKAFAPDVDASAVTALYKTAQFNLKGNVTGSSVALNDSVLKLDDMVVGLGGSYRVPSAGGRAKAAIDISADSIDFDKFIGVQGEKSSSTGANSKSTKESLKPLQDFSLPLDFNFDLSVQKARINQADLSGLRLTGDLTGNALNLKSASVNDFAGATISLKGKIANLSALSGLDLNIYTKTNNVGQLAKALKMDISKLPAGVSALEASLSGKGTVEQLNFNANVKALGGQLQADGIAKDILGAPSYSNLGLGLKHPNLVKAVQIVSPGFEGQAGLQQAIDFYAKANINGQQYNLSDMKVNLGATSFGGGLNINAGANPVSVRGNIVAGKIALDSLLGAKFSGDRKSSGGSSSKSEGGWSKSPIDLGFMKTMDVDVDLSASSLAYGAWNFTKPSTSLKIANGQLNIKGMKAGVFGGSATLTTQVNATPVSVSISSAMNNIDVASLAKALSGSNKLKATGNVDFNLNVNATGGSSHALVNALNGKANLNGKDVTIKGFDLAKLAGALSSDQKLLSSAANLVSGALNGGQTKFDTVKGSYQITNGKVEIQSMAMDNVEAVIISTGYANLPSWFIKTNHAISLKNVEDFKPFNIEIKGSLDSPATFGKNILEDYASDKLKNKIAKKLPDILGDKATDKLQKLGIVASDGGLDTKSLKPENLINNFLKPKAVESAKEAAPVTPVVEKESVNDNTKPVETKVEEAAPKVEAPAAPEPVKVESKKAPAPKKIEKPEDAVKELLNSDNPEDALKGVINGLF